NTAGSDFLWSPGNETTSTLMVGPTTDTWYYVQAGYMNCWSSPDSTQVLLPEQLVTSISGTNAICPGGTAQLDVSVSGGWDTQPVVWTPGNLTGNTIQVSPPATQLYTAVVSGNCQSDTLTHQVTVYPEPDPSFTVTGSGQCTPVCATFDLSSVTGL